MRSDRVHADQSTSARRAELICFLVLFRNRGQHSRCIFIEELNSVDSQGSRSNKIIDLGKNGPHIAPTPTTLSSERITNYSRTVS